MKHTILILAIFSLTMGCSKSPDQYKKEPVKTVTDLIQSDKPHLGQSKNTLSSKPDINAINYTITHPSGGIDISGVTPDILEDQPEKIRKNSSQSISYKDSRASNIQLTTTLTESQEILSRPSFGPDSRGWAIYKEGLWINWKDDPPRKVNVIFLNTGYLGTLSIPQKRTHLTTPQTQTYDVILGAELREHFPNDDKFGESFIVDMFNLFEDRDPTYNCLKTGLCKIDSAEDQFIVFELPRMVLLFSNDQRKSLFRIVLQRSDNPGRLDTAYDLIKGEFAIQLDQGQRDQASLNMKWGDFLEKGWETKEEQQNAMRVESNVKARSFVNHYGKGIALVLSKSKYEPTYVKPDKTETLIGVALYSPNTQPVLLNGKYVEVSLLVNDTVSLKLVSQATNGNNYLRVKNTFLSNNSKAQKDLIQKLGQIIEDEVAKTVEINSTHMISYRHIGGLNSDAESRSFSYDFSYYNRSTSEGRYFSVEIDENTGDMSFYVSIYEHPTDSLLVPYITQPVDANSGVLRGLELGEMVKISNVDLGRGEATLEYKGMKFRTGFTDKYQADLLYKVGQGTSAKIEWEYQRMWATSINGIGLGLNLMRSSVGPLGDKIYEAEISMITSHLQRAGLKNLCGLTQFDVQFSENDTEFLKRLLEAIGQMEVRKVAVQAKVDQLVRQGFNDPFSALTVDEKAAFDFKGCIYRQPSNASVDRRRRELFFPEQNLVILFTRASGEPAREVYGVSIYKKPNQNALKGEL